MKHTKLLALMTAALTGISAAANFPALQKADPMTAYAASNISEPVLIGNIRYAYYLDSNEAFVYGCSGDFRRPSTKVTVESEFAGRPVTKIGRNAFNCKVLLSVTLPDTIKEIEENAFFGSNIPTINLPDSLEKVGVQAFAQSAVEEVLLPESVDTLPAEAFWGCKKLTNVAIPGATTIGRGAFDECTELTSITMRADCTAEGCDCQCLFADSPNISKINGYTILSEATDENGRTYPVIDPHTGSVVSKFFMNCPDMIFPKTYTERLCEYIVKTEIDPWMNDALKARQLHDWMIRHSEVNKVTAKRDIDMLGTSFFLSSGASPNGVGKAVCTSYAKAYTMLLTQAGIESHVIYGEPYSSYAWNLVKIEKEGVDEYYQVDVYNDDMTNAHYKYFLKSDAEMAALHKSYNFTAVMHCAFEHEQLLGQYEGEFAVLKPLCNRTYFDENEDGILDYDFDLDGVYFNHDFTDDVNALQGFIGFAYGFTKSSAELNDRLGDVITELRKLNMGYWDYVNNAAPHDVTVARGEAAEFKVTLFGENLTYQWMMYIPRTGTWNYIENASGIQPTLRIPAESCVDGAQYRCIVNSGNYTIWSNPVTLTVTN